MNGRYAKKIRREVQKSEKRIAAQTSTDFKKFIKMVPWWGRVIIAWKVLRKTL